MPIFLRMRAVVRMTGVGCSTIYRVIADRSSPAPYVWASTPWRGAAQPLVEAITT